MFVVGEDADILAGDSEANAVTGVDSERLRRPDEHDIVLDHDFVLGEVPGRRPHREDAVDDDGRRVGRGLVVGEELAELRPEAHEHAVARRHVVDEVARVELPDSGVEGRGFVVEGGDGPLEGVTPADEVIPKKVSGFEWRSAGGPSSTISPSRMMEISSERNIASSWEWVTYRTVVLNSR